MRSHEDHNGSQQPGSKVSCILCAELFNNNRISEVGFLQDAYLLFQALQTLLNNFDLVTFDQNFTYELVSVKKAEEAFQLIEVELGFKYDRLYYKVTMISRLRIILRSITFLSSIFALVSFSSKSKSVYSRNDRIISYVLLIGVVCLESYSIIVHLLSDWGMIWLSRSEIAYSIVSRITYRSWLVSFCMKSKRWSRLIGQHNMIRAQSNKPVSKILKKYFPGKWNVDSREKVDKELKELIFKQVLNKRSRYNPSTDDFNDLEILLEERGLEVLRSKHCFHTFGWTVAGVEFIHSLLTWHIATHVCYFDDTRKNTFDKTRNCSLDTQDGWSNDKKWEMISEVWVDMLMYAASHCRWKEHVHALSQASSFSSSRAKALSGLVKSERLGFWNANEDE
ncbi:hypothetical protein D5086_011931 [Populus alba]|uniref:Uncharacterized protein n=1 Tax=Populus alba TaxID=43335 RepID=A0ACC4C0Q7_POPAL